MEDLSNAFEWAIGKSNGEGRELWQFHYGSWLAGRDEKARAVKVLSSSNLGVAKALLSRLLKLQGDHQGALKALSEIGETWLQLHPQIIIERDKLLRLDGRETIALRESWLDRVEALEDEWIIERRVQLLIDKGQYQAAKELLLSTPFQKVHQTYTRTNLWNQICGQLNEPCKPVPASLGEDQLATFGAYREFE
jgi:hypothetical protein